MKKIKLLFYISFFTTLISCDNTTTVATTAKKELKINGLYSFAQTEDPNLCNPESIVGSDCAGGDIYFAANNAVIFMFYCQGQDSISYEIGKYEIKDTIINCNFTSSYSYLYDELDTLNQEIHKGVMQALKTPSNIVVKPTKCSDFPFFLSLKWEGEGEYNYVIKQSDSTYARHFLLEMEKIKPFNKYIKHNAL